MNTADIKRYAPQARKDFIAAVTGRAALYGLTRDRIEPVTVQGDVAIIGGRAHPRAVAVKRQRLEERVAREGLQHTIEAIAYTWFNRFAALRYMELHGYLGHGYRVLSHPGGETRPEILDHAAEVDLPGLDRATAMELKLDGTKDEELYRLLLLAQCNALHEAMPFLFERLGDETELLLPGNLLHSGSLVRKLVEEIGEEQWSEIEIVGWLYQFYISEKKDEVIGKVVKSEDIPAATQLFTPNWIVKYMVQNSLGAQWLETYPDSPLKAKMEYYIEPAEQTEEVKTQLAAITPETLNPEALTLIDPACGSGHILVEAYELFKAIYLERGYRLQDLPKLILEKNLFGLDIDERAAQLTGFALMMKGRADDRRLFQRGVKLNVMALVDSAGFDAAALAKGVDLSSYGLTATDLTELKRLFEHATTFGSLIQVPEGLAPKLPALRRLSHLTSQNLFVSEALKRLGPLVRQAELLAGAYDNVVANPPYMGSGGMNAAVKKFASDYFPDAKSDLFACFIELGFILAKASGYNAMVTMQSWMFLPSFERLRRKVIQEHSIRCLAHFPYENRTPTAMGINFGVAAFSTSSRKRFGQAHFCCGHAQDLDTKGKPIVFPPTNERLQYMDPESLTVIPGCPLAYWASERLRSAFRLGARLADSYRARTGMTTGDDERFLRRWHEVPLAKLNVRAGSVSEFVREQFRWAPYNKGGIGHRWFGHCGLVVNWDNDGAEIKEWVVNNPNDPNTTSWSRRVYNSEYFFSPGVTWTFLNSRTFNVRLLQPGSVMDRNGPTIPLLDSNARSAVLGFLNSNVSRLLMQIMNPTAANSSGDVGKLPYVVVGEVGERVDELVADSQESWNSFETAWDFESSPLLTISSESGSTLESSYVSWIAHNRKTIAEMQRLEEENNGLFIDAYGLQDELTPEVPIEQITLTVNPAYRYGGKLSEEEQWTRFREDTMRELVSYAIGCMMGRYSLDEPGIVYANSGNEGFDPSRYTTFPADADGIIPLTDTDWFADDACHRLVEFLSVAWDKAHLEENLTFLAANLSPKRNETPRETLRRYLSDSFFKDHLQTYKKRPIYWLFSSGKQRAFQALVYLHRYNEGTLARMRTEYVVPLQGMIASQIGRLADDLQKLGESGSTAQRKRLEKERDRLLKHRTELQEFDEKLRHYADMRIALALDDGVKVNYGKFGDLLAEVKAVTGGGEDD